ncbi:MAG TPA: hypothetical protein VFR11_01000 [Micromonosporaceae bacterium]|jgi:hypothetical protein|nr:hypothetical protein [Micromonosporaceae bacterium]
MMLGVAEKKNPLGPAGELTRQTVRTLRLRRNLQYKQISEALAAVGRPIPTLGLSRLEDGDRRVDVDDLVALSLVFDLPAAGFLLPGSYREGQQIEVAPGHMMRAEDAWRKVGGDEGWPRKGLTAEDGVRLAAVLAPIGDAVRAALAAGATPGEIRAWVDNVIKAAVVSDDQ